ncbi:general substrate transporter [Dichomitus squalens]|uniref:General substrate transporter n=1 Tax=Dichomitus squalens TaxID=114155 RepID=A0A4Q9MBN8_9APHY|nr:general substrate transporter [Dichomitus squalens]
MGTGPTVDLAGKDGGYRHLLDPNKKWYNNRRLIVLNAWLVLLLITSSTNGYDGSMMNALESEKQWNTFFGNPEGGKLGLFNAIQNIGSLAGYPFAPYVADGIGRRKSVWLGACIMCVAVAIQTAAQSFGMFIGARFLIGFGLTFASNAAPMLVTELSYPQYRAPLTSMYNGLWIAGSIVSAWVTFGTQFMSGTWSWRIPSLLQGLPSIIQVCLVLFAPESPRWLVSKGRDAEAIETLAYYHADGNKNDPLIVYEYEEIKAAIDFDRRVAANVGYKSLFSTPGNRRRMRIIIALAFFSQWSGNGLISYYLSRVFDTIGITSSVIQLLINAILQMWSFFWASFGAFTVERFGRRALFLSSVAGMTLFFTLQTVCSSIYAQRGSVAASHTVIAMIFLFGSCYSVAFSPLIVSYTVEILPYSIRAKGFNVFNFTISLALIFNQYVNPIALDKLGWKYYIFYVCWLAFEGAYCYLFVIETKGLSLEETAALFDGDDAAERIAQHAMQLTGADVREDADTEKEKASVGETKDDFGVAAEKV